MQGFQVKGHRTLSSHYYEIFQRTHRYLLDELLHVLDLLHHKVVHEAHVLLLGSEASKVGQILQHLGHQGQLSGRLLVGVLCQKGG